MECKIFLLPNKPDNQYLVSLKNFDSLPVAIGRQKNRRVEISIHKAKAAS
jgi:hypothetical protein